MDNFPLMGCHFTTPTEGSDPRDCCVTAPYSPDFLALNLPNLRGGKIGENFLVRFSPTGVFLGLPVAVFSLHFRRPWAQHKLLKPGQWTNRKERRRPSRCRGEPKS